MKTTAFRIACVVTISTMGDNNMVAMEKIKEILRQVSENSRPQKWTCQFEKNKGGSTWCHIGLAIDHQEWEVWQEAALSQLYRVIAIRKVREGMDICLR